MPKLHEEVELITRGFCNEIEVRAIDSDTRTAEFVAATENGVDTWNGKEHLRMSGVKLTRYRKNPIVLDTHDRYSARSIIGKADVKVEGKQLVASVTFAGTARAEEVWQLVKGGFLRALSVGFMPNRKTMKDLMDNETDGEGDDKITGPARVIRSWELLEISVVPVPADADAIRRNFESQTQTVAAVLAALGITPRPQGAERTLTMDEKPETTGGAPKEGTEPKREAAVVEIAPEARALQIERETGLTIRGLAPKGMERLADELVCRKVSVEDARNAFLTELEKQTKPVGTTEPAQPATKRGYEKITAQDLLG